MDENKYVCEPHYDEKGNFDYWNPLFPYKRDTCEGCRDEFYGDNCQTCIRYHRLTDCYEPKVVE